MLTSHSLRWARVMIFLSPQTTGLHPREQHTLGHLFSRAFLCKRWACQLPPKSPLGHKLSSPCFATPGPSSRNTPAFHHFILLDLITPTSINMFSWFLPPAPAIFFSSFSEENFPEVLTEVLSIPVFPQPTPVGLYPHSFETVLC